MEKLATKQAEKRLIQEEEEKRRELERRKSGQENVKFKQWKEEQEKKEVENALKKAKEEKRREREKVLADLEQDRFVVLLFLKWLSVWDTNWFISI